MTDELSHPTPATVSLPGPDVPVVELVAPTPRAEARTAMALVAVLRDQDIPVRDMAIVVRNLDTYERLIRRAGTQYGLTTTCWTQLRVTRTRPYALLQTVCTCLACETVDVETLLRPLTHRWAPPGTSSDTAQWPLDAATIQQARQRAPAGSRALSTWQAVSETSDEIDDRVCQFLQWLQTRPPATVDDAAALLDAVLETYRHVGLPQTKAQDSPALGRTERETQAITRLHTAIEALEQRYQRRLDSGGCDRSWDAVASLIQESVTQRPGGRAHANATAIDVFEASGCWALDRPFVVVVGLVAGLWPRDDSPSAFGAELQAAIIDGSGPAASLVPRTSWTTGADRDQFAATLRAPSTGLIVTRHTATREGETRHRSVLLDSISTEQVDEQARRHLVGPDRRVPAPIDSLLALSGPADERGPTQRPTTESEGDADD